MLWSLFLVVLRPVRLGSGSGNLVDYQATLPAQALWWGRWGGDKSLCPGTCKGMWTAGTPRVCRRLRPACAARVRPVPLTEARWTVARPRPVPHACAHCQPDLQAAPWAWLGPRLVPRSAQHLAVPVQLLDMKIFVDTDSDIRLVRRLRRDISERGRDIEGVIKQYNKFVKPAFDQYIQPTMRVADIVVPWGEPAHLPAVGRVGRRGLGPLRDPPCPPPSQGAGTRWPST